MIDYALAYAARGWAVLPIYAISNGGCTCHKRACNSPGKHPRLRKWVTQASTDPARIKEWWRSWPDSGVGITTGDASSLFVLDVDVGKAGFDTLEQLQNEHGSLPVTLSQATGGGGRHYLFKWPEQDMRSNAGALGSGLDIRASGGFIVAPPSAHVSGNVYAWKSNLHDSVIAPVPQWIIEQLLKPKAEATGGDSEVIAEGGRNSFLTSLGGRLRRESKTRQVIRVQLAEANAIKCHPPLDPSEVERIADSVSRYRKGAGPDVPVLLYRDWLKSPEGPDDAMTCHVLRTLADYMDSQGRNCFPNVDDLAAVTKINEKTVRRHLKKADEAGWIGRYKKPVSGGKYSYGYFIPPALIKTMQNVYVEPISADTLS